MRVLFSLSLFVLVSLLSFTFVAEEVTAQEIVELQLPNSNKVIIKLMFRNGSISDLEGKQGLTNATANMVIQGGTTELSYSDIQDRIYPMAARYGASTDKEVTTFTFEVHQDYLDEFYPVIKGLILTPRFDENDFNRLMLNQQNFVDQVIRASSDEEYSKKALEDLLFRGTNYQHMKEGKSDSVKNITLDDIKSHYQQMFSKQNLILGIAGNYSEVFLSQLKEDLAALPDSVALISEAGKAREADGIEVEIIAKEGAFGSVIFTGFPLQLDRSDDEFAALMVANSWFGEHRKSYSRLYQKIREARSMNYGDYSYIEWYDNGGRNMLPPSGVPRSSNYFSIWIRPVQIASQLRQQYPELKNVELGHAHFALRMAIKELSVLIEEGLSEEEFEATRTFLRSYTKLYAQTPAARLGYLMDSRFYGRDDYLLELDQLLSDLSREDVNNAVSRHWQTQNMFVTIVTDSSEAEKLATSLLNNTSSPMSYSDVVASGLSDELLREDAVVADFQLNVKSVKIVDSADTFQ